MLGQRITNAAVEGTGDADEVAGLGLLPVETRFRADKRVEPVTRQLHGCGPLDGASGSVTGYEIHMGRTRPVGTVTRPFPESGAATDRVLGTYLHGLFENDPARRAFAANVAAAAGRESAVDCPDASGPGDGAPDRAQTPYDRAAALLRESVDLAPLGFDA
jgi:adenosylcobyric acid synthase